MAMRVRRRNPARHWPLLLLPLMAGACTFLLPRGEAGSQGNWTTFSEAKGAYDSILEGRTFATELEPLGFHPSLQPNLTELDYLDVIRVLVPRSPLAVADLPDPLRRCIDARQLCRGIRVEVTRRSSERIGFWVLDMLRFRRQTHTTGWDFTATLVLVDDVVVYKTWRGVPEVDEFLDEIRPLGPLQEPLDLLRAFLF